MIETFIAKGLARDRGLNEWLVNDDVELYLRKDRHMGQWCLTIANIEVMNKRQGFFSKRLLPCLIELNPWPIIYIENVHSRWFKKWLLSKGWLVDGSVCFYKETANARRELGRCQAQNVFPHPS